MWENQLTIEDINNIIKEMVEKREECRTYPVVIFGLDDDVVSEALKRRDEAYEKYGLTLNKVETIEQLDYHLKCNTYYRTPILFVPNTEQFRVMAFNDNNLLKNGKIFTAVNTIDNKIKLMREYGY